MSRVDALYWLTGIGDSKLHNAVSFHGDKIGILSESMRGELARSLAKGSLGPDQNTKVRWIDLADIAAVARSVDGVKFRIEQSNGKRIQLTAVGDDRAKLEIVFDTLKTKIAPNAELQETQATFREAAEAPAALLILFAAFSGAMYLWLGLGDSVGPGRRGIEKLLYSIGLGNIMLVMGVLTSLALLWGILRLVNRPRMTMFCSERAPAWQDAPADAKRPRR
jgi:hypothetical protein